MFGIDEFERAERSWNRPRRPSRESGPSMVRTRWQMKGGEGVMERKGSYRELFQGRLFVFGAKNVSESEKAGKTSVAEKKVLKLVAETNKHHDNETCHFS